MAIVDDSLGNAQRRYDYVDTDISDASGLSYNSTDRNDDKLTNPSCSLRSTCSTLSQQAKSPKQWQPRPRFRPKGASSRDDNEGSELQPPIIGGSHAETLGPFDGERGLADWTRSLKLFASPRQKLQHQFTVAASVTENKLLGTSGDCSLGPSIGFPKTGGPQAAASEVQHALLCPPFSPTAGIAFRHEFVLKMSKKSTTKSKRLGRSGGGGADIMDSLVSSIDAIAPMPMRVPVTNGHHRHPSDEYENIIMVSPAPVIQTSKSSTRSPTASVNRLSRKPSIKNSARDAARQSLRTSTSQDHWLPPIEQEEDFLSGTSLAHRSYSSSPSSHSAKHLSIPTRTTSITRDTPQLYIPQRSNSLMIPPPSPRSAQPRRSGDAGDIPSYIHRYLRTSLSKENLQGPESPRRSTHSSRPPPRSRNSTTGIPANDPLRPKLPKRSSTQGFERDLAATRHYYSLPPPPHSPARLKFSRKPSRDSVASSVSGFSRVNSNYVQEVLDNPKLTQRIRLTTGRILSFSEVGDKNGWPVFCFTGMGLNRLVAGTNPIIEFTLAFYDEVATSFGLRIITPDRPGIGLSEEIRPSPKKVLAWAGHPLVFLADCR
jgi:hypothetical protein